MATADECRAALEGLLGRLDDLDPADREAHLVDRAISCTVKDLGVTFLTQLGPAGAGPVTVANGSASDAHIRLSTASDDLVALAADPGSFGRAWLSGRLRVQASLFDLLRLRKLL
jgi:predicted lipid carrier protein YhbT